MNATEIKGIDEIRREYKDEWLLITVDEVNPDSGAPSKGYLIAHGPHRMDIHEASKSFEGEAYVVYSEDWPDDLAACFNIFI